MPLCVFCVPLYCFNNKCDIHLHQCKKKNFLCITSLIRSFYTHYVGQYVSVNLVKTGGFLFKQNFSACMPLLIIKRSTHQRRYVRLHMYTPPYRLCIKKVCCCGYSIDQGLHISNCSIITYGGPFYRNITLLLSHGSDLIRAAI